MKVFVYWNLKKKLFSIKSLESPTYGIVIGHAEEVNLRDCEFKVSQAGRNRVLREKKKNVHAGVKGTIYSSLVYNTMHGTRRIRYNPYEEDHFFYADTKEPIDKANFVTLSQGKIYAL